MSNTYSKRKARVVVSSLAATTGGDTSANFANLVNTAGFYSSSDEYYYLKLADISNVALAVTTVGDVTTNAATNPLVHSPLEVRLETVGQIGSYDTRFQAESRVVGLLNRNEVSTTNVATGYGAQVVWQFVNVLDAIPIRTDELCNKSWRLRVCFTAMPTMDIQTAWASLGLSATYVPPIVAAFSVSKDP